MPCGNSPGCVEGAVGTGTHHTSSQGDPILVQLIRVQHAQLDSQLPVLVSNDGEGQLLCRLLPVVGIDVLQRQSQGMFLWHHHRDRGQAETGAAGAPDLLSPRVSGWDSTARGSWPSMKFPETRWQTRNLCALFLEVSQFLGCAHTLWSSSFAQAVGLEQKGIPACVSDTERFNHLSLGTVSLFQLSPRPGSSTADRSVGVTAELDCALKELFLWWQSKPATLQPTKKGPTLPRPCKGPIPFSESLTANLTKGSKKN